MSGGKRYICLDIGGTYIKHGLLTEKGEILTTGKIPTRAKEGGQAVFEQAVELVEDYLEKEEQKPSGIAISTAGMVDPEAGVILHASMPSLAMQESITKHIWKNGFICPVRWRMM